MAPASTTSVTDPTAAADSAACTASTSEASLGAPTDAATGGQITLSLRYTNTTDSPCTTAGYPGATLRGPDLPGQGPEFQLSRSTIRESEPLVVAPGESAIADLTVLTTSPGDAGSWQPSELLTTAPNDTTPMTVTWPPNTAVVRQDGATNPGSYIGPFHTDN